MKKWVRRFARFTVALAVGALLLGFAARRLAIREAHRDFPAPGRLVEFDQRTSHLHCLGSGTPTIILESGLDLFGSSSWAPVQGQLSQFSRVCSYDRAGYLWSEPRAEPRDAEKIAQELHTLLATASEAGPYVMVGHSLGGALVRVFDELYPGEVAGFVLVDSSHPEQDGRFPAEIRERIAQMDGQPRWLLRLLAPFRMFAPEQATPRTAYFWRSLPEGVLGEAAAVSTAFEQALATGSMGDRPLIVLSAGEFPDMPGVSDAAQAEMRSTLALLQVELAALSTDSDHRIIEDAAHYIHRDRPEAVVGAVAHVVRAVRASESLESTQSPS